MLKLLPGFKITERNNLAIILIYSLLETPFMLTLQHFFLNQNNLFWVLVVNINLGILDFHFFWGIYAHLYQHLLQLELSLHQSSSGDPSESDLVL